MIVVDVRPSGDGWIVRIELPGQPIEHRMLAGEGPDLRKVPLPHPDRRPQGAAGEPWDISAEDVEALFDRADRKVAGPDDLRGIGRHLFESLLGPDGWRAIEAADPGVGPIAVGLRSAADEEAVQGIYWELLHDGQGYLALRQNRPLVLVRIVRGATGQPRTITGLPRVLFAVGSSITDISVKAGSELRGLLHGLERGGGRVQSRVVADVSWERLETVCSSFQPDIVHLAGHGRWDEMAREGVIELRSEDGKQARECGAGQIGAAIGTPAAVLLSACSTATGRNGGTSLAAQLVAGGVPLVFAMAGEISDTACRVFTRSVMGAIYAGGPVLKALSDGRRAAYLTGRSTAQTIDWALPCVIASQPLSDELTLVSGGEHRLEQLIRTLGLTDRPVFAGRDECLEDLEELLGPGGRSQLVLLSPRSQRLGGTRVLRELGAAALRRGDLPFMIGPMRSQADAPTTFGSLLWMLAEKMIEVAESLGVSPPLRLRARAAGLDPDQASEFEIRSQGPVADVPEFLAVGEARADLFALRDRLAALEKSIIRPDAVPLLLFDDTQYYDKALAPLLKLLKGNGFGAPPPKVPVVLFGKLIEGVGQTLADYKGQPGWTIPRTLPHVTELGQDRDLWVCLAWYLHPEPETPGAPTLVYAPVTPPEKWKKLLRPPLAKGPFYDRDTLNEIADGLVAADLWTADNDNDILAAFGLTGSQ